MQADTETAWRINGDDHVARRIDEEPDVDFNASLAPNEKREYRPATAQRHRGAEAARPGGDRSGGRRANRQHQVWAHRSPLVVSANYRGEFIGQGQNGFAAIDSGGARHDLSTATDLKVEIVKRGPLVAVLQFTGKLSIENAAPPSH
jgi:hypothetical protein